MSYTLVLTEEGVSCACLLHPFELLTSAHTISRLCVQNPSVIVKANLSETERGKSSQFFACVLHRSSFNVLRWVEGLDRRWASINVEESSSSVCLLTPYDTEQI